MAAITVTRARPVSPPGYEVNDKCVLASDVVAGDQLVYTGTVTDGLPVMDLAATAAVEADAIALQNGYTGQRGFSVGIQGEMDGFSGLTAGAPLYPSTATAGKLDTTATISYNAATTPAVAVPAPAKVKAVSATRIRYNYL